MSVCPSIVTINKHYTYMASKLKRILRSEDTHYILIIKYIIVCKKKTKNNSLSIHFKNVCCP